MIVAEVTQVMSVSPISLIDIHLSTTYLLFYIEGNSKKKKFKNHETQVNTWRPKYTRQYLIIQYVKSNGNGFVRRHFLVDEGSPKSAQLVSSNKFCILWGGKTISSHIIQAKQSKQGSEHSQWSRARLAGLSLKVS